MPNQPIHRVLLGIALTIAGLGLALCGNAAAQTYKSKYKEIVWAIIPAENASGVTERFQPMMSYLTKELGIPVKMRIASAYSAVIEGQRAGQIHVAMYGPAAYARAHLIGVPMEPFAMDVNLDGTKGYFAVLFVKKDAPYKTIQDLKGRNIGFVDPNSTSGNDVPRYALHKMGITPEKFFGKVVYTGSHENAITALSQGTIDAAFNWWSNDKESNLARMERKGMARSGDFRIIFTSDEIVNAPMAYLKSLPEDLKKAIRDAVFNFAEREPAAFAKVTDGKAQPWIPVTHKVYEPVIELTRFVDRLRRKR